MLLGVMGLDIPVRFTGQVRPGDPLHLQGDPTRAREFGARCETTLADGLKRTVAWFLEEGGREAATTA
jgi:nucleoside-diphosphate-sugar epimerase